MEKAFFSFCSPTYKIRQILIQRIQNKDKCPVRVCLCYSNIVFVVIFKMDVDVVFLCSFCMGVWRYL